MSQAVQEFSIKDLEHFTGIKAHTIRAWEQRYKLLEPRRTSTNIRFYTSEDLKLLLNVSLLNQNGHKISHIAAMGDGQILTALQELEVGANKEEHWLGMLKISMLNFDEQLFRSVSKTFEDEHGLSALMLKLYLPFMGQIGMLWLTSAICPAHEHFVSNLIRQRLYRAVDEIEPTPPGYNGRLFAMFLPEREIHDISFVDGALPHEECGLQKPISWPICSLGRLNATRQAVPRDPLRRVLHHLPFRGGCP